MSLPVLEYYLTRIGIPERGLVVTIYLDSANPTWSTADSLKKLQDGGYGPFLGT